jgi:hypothetical protein
MRLNSIGRNTLLICAPAASVYCALLLIRSVGIGAHAALTPALPQLVFSTLRDPDTILRLPGLPLVSRRGPKELHITGFHSMALDGRTVIVGMTGSIIAVHLDTHEVREVVGPRQPQLTDSLRVQSGIRLDRPGAVWVTNFDNGALALLDLTRTHSNVLRLIRLDPGVLAAEPLVDGRIVANRFNSDDVLALYEVDAHDKSNEAIETASVARTGALGPFPGLIKDIGKQLNRSVMTVSPNKDKVAVAYSFSSQIDILNSDITLDRRVAGPVAIRVDFGATALSTGQLRFMRTSETRLAYICLASTSQHIFALFANRALGEYRRRYAAGDELHVFTWAGQLVGRWQLPEEINQFQVDPQRHVLVGITPEPRSSVVEIDVRTVLATK